MSFPPSLEGQRPEAAGDGSELLNMIGDLKFIFSRDFSKFFFPFSACFPSLLIGRSVRPALAYVIRVKIFSLQAGRPTEVLISHWFL